MARFSSWGFVVLFAVTLAGPALAGRTRNVEGPVEGRTPLFQRGLAEAAIPEPAAAALFALGAVAVGLAARRSQRSS
jgi:PEP-CTERM motif